MVSTSTSLVLAVLVLVSSLACIVPSRVLLERSNLWILKLISHFTRVITGMDDFAKATSGAWNVLEELTTQLPIETKEKQLLKTAIEKANLYLKSTYSIHCSDESKCRSHCTIYALSPAGKWAFSQVCSHEHESIFEGTYLLLRISSEAWFYHSC